MGYASLNRIIREGVMENMTFEQKPEMIQGGIFHIERKIDAEVLIQGPCLVGGIVRMLTERKKRSQR